MLPIRCFSCNKMIGQYSFIFEEWKKTKDHESFFQQYQISRYCCRKIFLTHVNIYDFVPPPIQENIICLEESSFPKILKAD